MQARYGHACTLCGSEPRPGGSGEATENQERNECLSPGPSASGYTLNQLRDHLRKLRARGLLECISVKTAS